jgi:hypothetical protein
MGSAAEEILYWQVNVPESQRTAECPDFLRNLNERDRGIISTPDSDYRKDTWPEVLRKVAENRLDLFQRVPSELRRYLGNNWKLKQRYGSIMNFVLTQRLRWDGSTAPIGRPFEFGDDIKVLYNDWPYGIDERIVHLVVWTKFELEEDPDTGDLTDKARAEIDEYVRETFASRLPRDRVRGRLDQHPTLNLTISSAYGSRTGGPSSLSSLLSTST